MSATIAGIVQNGVVVPNVPLPEGAAVRIQLSEPASGTAEMDNELKSPRRVTPTELRAMPRAERQAILAAAAVLAEQDYASGSDLTAFEAFAEEELDDDESDAR